MRILYVGYLGFENIGDEVCYEAFEQIVHRFQTTPHEVVALPLEQTIAEFHAHTPIDVVVIGGGSLLQGDIFLRLAEEAVLLGFPLYFYGTGIDFLPKKTARAYEKGELVLPKTYFAQKPVPEARIKKVLEEATYAGLRGPLTLQYSKSLGVVSDRVAIIGDSGFVFKPDTKELTNMLEGHDVVTPFVAVNWGTIFNKCYGFSEEAVEEQLVQSIEWLHEQGYRTIIYPMWTKDLPICERLYEKVKGLGSVVRIQKVHTASEISTFLGKAAFSINYKLHGNILSAGSGTPFVKLAYRSKGLDFSSSIDWLAHTITTDSEHILAAIQAAEKAFQSSSKREELRVQKEKYTALHEAFVRRLEEGSK